MKHKDFVEKYERDFFEKISREDHTTNSQIYKFITWCYNNGFFNNLAEDDIQWFLEDESIHLPLLTNDGVTIGIDLCNGESCRIGIDPTKYFDKTSKCSILMRLPITSKRVEKQFYSILEAIVRKDLSSREWYRDADTLFCGEYYTNM